ncbi:hypothetical protein ACF0H5_024422 [Mactra antiquata]
MATAKFVRLFKDMVRHREVAVQYGLVGSGCVAGVVFFGYKWWEYLTCHNEPPGPHETKSEIKEVGDIYRPRRWQTGWNK